MALKLHFLPVAATLLSLPLLSAAPSFAEEEREAPPERVSHAQMNHVATAAGAFAPSGTLGATSAEAGPALTWTAIGPRPISYDYWSTGRAAGRVSALAVDPRDGNKVYLAAAGGGVWKTTNGGLDWSVLTDGLSSLSSGALAIDPQHSDTVLYATGELHDSGDSFYGDGLFRSTNAGASWSQIAPRGTIGSYVARIAMHNTNSSILYSAGSRGFNRSVNGGVNWTPTLTVDWCYDLAVDPGNNDVVYTAAYGFGVYKSIDQGQTWTQLTNGIPFSAGPGESPNFQRINLAIAPSNPQVLYASFVDPSGLLYGMFRTADGGASWIQLAGTPDYLGGQGWYDNCLIVDPTDPNICYAGGMYPYGAGNHGVIRTANGGTSWTDITVDVNGNSVHPDQHIMAFGPANTLWLGNDGGVWKTSDGGQHWTDCNNDLGITQFYSTALHPANANAMLGGTQDNGTLIFNGNPVWNQVIAGDGGQCFYLWNDPSYYFTTYVRMDIFRFHNNLYDTDVSGPWSIEGDLASFILGPLSPDKNTPNSVLAGTNRVWRSNDLGASWDSLSGDLAYGIGVLRSIAVANGAPNTIYAATNTGRLWMTTDASFWDQRNVGLPSGAINDIVLKATDSQTAYISSDSPGSGIVWMTSNTATSWTNVSGDLPANLRGLCLEVDWSTSPPILYVGTDYGVYRSTDGGAHWVNENVGLPSLAVYDLKLSPSGSFIVAATHGRGMYRGSVGALAVGGPGGSSLRLAALNPSRPPAAIDYALAARGDVSLAVYDVAGRSVRTLDRGMREAGLHRAVWDGRDETGAMARDGIYFFRLTAGRESRAIKVALIR